MARKRLIIGVAVVAGVLVLARAILPVVARDYVNAKLERMGEYSGSVVDVDVALIRGAYVLEDLTVVKVDAETELPFLDLETMDISLQWRALFSGELVGEIVASNPELNLVQGASDSDTQLGTGVNWPDEIRELFPFRFNHVEVGGGTINFLAPGIDSSQPLTIENAALRLSNLTNVAEEGEDAFSEMAFAGDFLGAPLEIRGQVDPNADVPTFDFNFSLEDAELTAANIWLEEFLNVDAEQGTFSMYAEFAAAEGRFEGYTKPIIEDADIYQSGEEASGPFRRAWEGLVDLARNIFENRDRDQVAAEIPLSGEIENPDAGALAAIVSLLRNAFVAGLSHAIEGTVNLRDVDPDVELESDSEEAE